MNIHEKELICGNLSVSPEGHLLFAGADTAELAKEYGTPLYVMDEDRIRENCRTYLNSLKKAFGEKGIALYASKAASFKRIYNIVEEEGMYVDVVSSGEIYTALKAGFPLEKAYFHSNNKTDEDINFACDNNIGCFVVDTEEELYAIDGIAGKKGKKQKIMLRLTPGIDPHTYEEVATGKVDSKFGSAIETGQAEEITKKALGLPHIILEGFHCHVGSMVFYDDVFERSADVMLEFMADIKKKTGYEAEKLDLGGGYGVRYVKDDPYIDISAKIAELAAHIKKRTAELGLKLPFIMLEPGRSIVADAGITLYTAGSVKRITGFVNYVSIDGGMTDNPRYALYGSKYTVLPADNMNALCDMKCNLVGRCCESGDIIQNEIHMPADTKRGSIVAVLTTGAYNYSMASNYNRIGRPPIVMISSGKTYTAVRRETMEDMAALDL